MKLTEPASGVAAGDESAHLEIRVRIEEAQQLAA
jgi:hypothetical protein